MTMTDNAASRRVYLGFDRSDCPAPPALQSMKAAGFDWCCHYLEGAPSRPRYAPGSPLSWEGKLPLIRAAGLGTAVVYLGQQTTGPGSHIVTPEQGAIDGEQTVSFMQREGYPPGWKVWQDQEQGPPMPREMIAYMEAWAAKVRVLGYDPGEYTSFLEAATAAAYEPAGPLWVYRVPTVAQHRVPGKIVAPDLAKSGYPAAKIWQFGDECIVDCAAAPGGILLVDLNVADSADPSAPN